MRRKECEQKKNACLKMETKRALPQPTVTGTSRLAFQTERRKKEGKKK